MQTGASEWVSIGHPDKVADFISSYLLDRYIELDENTRYAVEVQIKGKFVTLGGEVTSEAEFSKDEIARAVREAVNQIGYTKEYQERWGAENTICGDELVVETHISGQSPDISRGVLYGGWGDQGIFWGLAEESESTDFMPWDWWLAKTIGSELYRRRIGGLDIKTLVSTVNGGVDGITVAIPIPENDSGDIEVLDVIKQTTSWDFSSLTVNGTGKFVKHGPAADCGTTGRKLAVDFYGGNCRVGGGSPWTKDGTKADLSLNLYARELALDYLKKHSILKKVFCQVSCSIGSDMVCTVMFDSCMNALEYKVRRARPIDLIRRYKLNKPVYAKLCMDGIFSMEKEYAS